TGYQVQTATDSSFTKNVKTYTVSGASKTASNYTNGKKYYVRVRAYKTVSGTKYYSAWSGKKSTYCLSAPSISSLKNVKTKKMTVKWSKNSKATGYQIQYSTSSSFSNYKTVTVTSYKTVSKTISKLTKKKKYYVRVRAYKTVSGTKYYSAWSGNKSVKISK
ncbi:MAG: fibronectin type III domain-containing protein, partial [Clostridiales bacterium]|nr:fibronectin type III domain-containing protein [Clostridiales bacterium]